MLQIQAQGAVYRMVIDVDDDKAAGTIRTSTIQAPFVGGAWSDGWHATPLDYVTNLGVHSASFAQVSTAAAIAWATASLFV